MRLMLAALMAMTVSLALQAAEGSGKEAKPSKYGDISLEDLKKAIEDKGVALIDCNGSESYAKGHIPGALDFKAVGEKLGEMLPEDKGTLIVAYCGGPKCNAYNAGANAAEKLGYTNVKHFSKGLSGWTEAGETLETPGGDGNKDEK